LAFAQDPKRFIPRWIVTSMPKCIQVGVGGFGRRWLKAVSNSDSVEHAALVDIDPKALEEASRSLDVDTTLTYTDYREAFECVDADFVLVVVPPFYHEEVTVEAFEHGFPVLTEKPMAHDMGSAKRMVLASRRTGLTLMVSQNYRFRRWIRSARAFLSGGRLGRISHGYVSFRLNPDWGPFRKKMEDVLLIEMSIHHFDMMRYLLGRDAKDIYARTWNPPWSWFRGDCAAAINIDMSGIPVLYEGSSVAFGKHTGWNGEWRLECEKGSLDFDEKRGLRWSHFEKGESQVPLVDFPIEDQEYSLREFTRSLKERRAPETNGEDNLKSLAMVFASLRSKSTGEPVAVKRLLRA